MLLGGQTVSAAGDAFSNVAMPLLVLRATGSVAQMGAIAGTSTAAQLVGSLLAGPTVDRWDRRRVLIACDVLQMLLGATIPLLWWSTTPGQWNRYAMWLIYPVVAASCVLIRQEETTGASRRWACTPPCRRSSVRTSCCGPTGG
jgi:MFS family permease